ncbi:exonuclease SbcCD subunit D [Caproiciproducens sp. LBM24188]|nr:exonuclease SbcCD subunit D [Oscillospiraceae bacterium]
MKLLHLADLHIGRRIGEFSMLEDQRYILQQILQIAEAERPQAVLMAGDIYDKSLPSGEAVELLDDFLTGLTSLSLPVFLISGNHDSPERLNFGSRIMGKNGVFIAGTYRGEVRRETLVDEFGSVHIYLLPYLKPAVVRPYCEGPVDSCDGAVRAALAGAQVDGKERNILVAHQFVTSGMQQPEQSDSETLSLGGLDNVDVSVFEPFDYVALGHLHGPQRIGRDTVRYSGSPLKYSFSESHQHKSVTVVELGPKGEVQYRLIPLVPMRDMREIRGPIEALLKAGSAEPTQDYIHATLTDEEEIYDAVGKLRQVYPNLMRLDFDNSRTRGQGESVTVASGDVARKSPLELFSEFYQVQNHTELNLEQRNYMQMLLEQAGGDVQ